MWEKVLRFYSGRGPGPSPSMLLTYCSNHLTIYFDRSIIVSYVLVFLRINCTPVDPGRSGCSITVRLSLAMNFRMPIFS
jgi:hypothetical protein